ncbi:MAG TPA: hypothetical protein ENN20_10305 [Candidatus Marinimicrobia bacterium]|nr:hypothetical protein [Candidatus Neomarinimicrobiota bacterium]
MSDIINQKISALFSKLVTLVVGTFLFNILTYGGNFSFWYSAFSDLGSTTTPQGEPNLISCLIFVAGFMICGMVLVRISRLFNQARQIRHHRAKSQLCLLGSIGCFIFVFPHNINNDIHMIGAAMFVAALWALGTLILIESYNQLNKEQVLLLQAVLQITVLSYAITYFADLPVKNIAQKFATFGLLIVLKISTSAKIRTVFAGFSLSTNKQK